MVASVLMMRLPKVQGKFASGLLSLHQVMREHGLCNWQGLSFLLCWSITGLFKKKKLKSPLYIRLANILLVITLGMLELNTSCIATIWISTTSLQWLYNRRKALFLRIRKGESNCIWVPWLQLLRRNRKNPKGPGWGPDWSRATDCISDSRLEVGLWIALYH